MKSSYEKVSYIYRLLHKFYSNKLQGIQKDKPVTRAVMASRVGNYQITNQKTTSMGQHSETKVLLAFYY